MNAEKDLAMRDAASAYARSGWSVFPVQARGKRPLTPKGLYDATVDLEAVQAWWSRWPAANIGLPVPDGYLVLDLDSKEALHRIKADDLTLPATVSARTGRGWHLWYEVPGQARNRVGVLPGVDIRATGGYVVAPPSTHPSGTRYRWQVALKRSAIAEAPEWLMGLLHGGSLKQDRSTASWAETIAASVSAGQRNQTLARVAGLLFRQLPAEVATEVAYCWACVKLDPRLPDREVFQTLESIAKCELRRRGDDP